MSGTQTTGHDAPPDFKRSAAIALANARLGAAMDAATRRQDTGRRTMMPELGDPMATRNLGARIKDHTLQNLDRYLAQLADNVSRSGGKVHFASDAEQARRIIADIARQAGVQHIVKSKSMASEEIHLNTALEAAGFEVAETDLGEYILQIAGEAPSHIVTPVLHRNREDIGRLFADKLGIEYTTDPPTLTAHARRILREKFKAADMGITGANFAVAETGTICIVTNEGNGRFTTSRPRVLVTLMGMEKVIPRMCDLTVFLKLLSKSATGQRMTCYTNLVTGPRRSGDADGPEEFHLVIIDYGRSNILRDPRYREVLRCIRCGACLNACPVYRKIGGHAYESVYPGPIGKVITPLLRSLPMYKDLPNASSLCEACYEACPMRINLPQMLLNLRNDQLKAGKSPLTWRLGFKGWRIGMSSKLLYRMGSMMGRLFMSLLARDGWVRRMPAPPASVWTGYRDLPVLAKRPFHKRWPDLQRELNREGKP
ncbi:MAG TPA: LutB/LldF family L-lactate oxidation iron-sulfur protein [Phycisphaerae bacterium]|nr:LutB/LldF family L-lactate oxidation iron-sulfur protein [Phycisphaerae bacterium]